MKKLTTIIIASLLCFSILVGCGNNAEIEAVKTSISEIGTVDVNSESKIIAAETAYNALSEADKAKVDNYSVLVAAREAYDKIPYELSKQAYDKINSAYEIAEKFGSDIYEAWRLGIYSKNDILKEGLSVLDDELSLTEDELKEGMIAYIAGDDYDTLTDDDREYYSSQSVIKYFEEDLFSFCVSITSSAYEKNGKTEEAQKLLDEAKALMKQLSDKYSDYEHYPALKGYFTTTSSLFDFCQNPTGSFEQVKTTMEDYKTTARDYKADLDYIFED